MKKLITICLILALTLSLVAVVTTQNDDVVANASTSAPYALYPVPQQIEFGGGIYDLPRKVSVSFGSTLDTYTVNHAWQALSKMDLVGYSNRDDLSYKFYFGVYNSNDQADSYVKTLNLTIPQGMFDKIDAYLLYVGQNATVVLGKDTDATFFGISSLAMIFEQSTANKLHQTTIYDWADSIYRGFIEGYYGIPWTTDERVELMEFAGQFKSNIYIYAPKDDPYHSTNWRGLYTETDLEEIKEQVEAGNRNKVRFTWSIHPLLQKPLKQATYAEDLQVLLAKFEQLYSAGVRSFMVSADDISTGSTTENPSPKYDATFQKTLLNDVAKWLRDKGDCHNLIFVPSAYNSNANANLYLDKEFYFQTLMGGVGSDGVDRGATLDETIDVMWTGEKVCSSVSNGTFDDFSNLTGGRKAFMWMNWPVNDYLPNTILMSKGQIYDVKTDANGEVPFTGIVTNPMQYAEASKVGIFATADYCWNVDGFDVDKSYQDSFAYIEENCADELYNISSHIANASKFEEEYFDESWTLTDNISAFWNAYHNNDQANAVVQATILKGLFDDIVADVDNYLANAQNQNLVKNLRPFAQSLKYKSLGASIYLDTYVNIDSMTTEDISQNLLSAKENVNKSNNCCTFTLNTVTYNHDLTPVNTCVAVINPFLSDLEQYVSDDIMLALGVPTGIVYRGFDGIYQGNVENIIDGNLDTFVWFNNYPKLHQAYVRIDYGQPQEIRDVTVYGGNNALGDTWKAILQYSNDGQTWTNIGNVSGAQTSIDLREQPITARFLRILDNSTAKENDPTVGNSWCALREIALNQPPEVDPVTVSGFTLYNQDQAPGADISLDYIIDDDLNSMAWFADGTSKVDAYIQLNFSDVQRATYIRLLMAESGGDYLTNVQFSYSLDGVNFITIDNTEQGRAIHVYLSQVIEFRFLRVTSLDDNSGVGIKIRDFSFDVKPIVTFDGLTTVHQGNANNIIDGDVDSYVWFGESLANVTENKENYFVTVDYLTTQTIYNVTLHTGYNASGADAWDVDVYYLDDNGEWQWLGLCNNSTSYVSILDVSDNPVTTTKLKLVHNKAKGWVALRELQLNVVPIASSNMNIYSAVAVGDCDYGNVVDGNVDTIAWFDTYNKQNDATNPYYLQLTFVNAQTIEQISLLMARTSNPNDYFKSYQLYYSVNGVDFVAINDTVYTSSELTLTLQQSLENVVAIRAVCKDEEAFSNDVIVREFSVNNASD